MEHLADAFQKVGQGNGMFYQMRANEKLNICIIQQLCNC